VTFSFTFDQTLTCFQQWSPEDYFRVASQVVRINGADNWTMAIFLPVKMIGKVEDVLAPIFQGGFEVFVWTKTNHHTQDAGNHLGSCVEHILLCYYAKGGTRLREHYNYAPDESRQDFLGCRVPRSFYYNGSPVNRTQKPMMLISHLILHFSVEGSWNTDFRDLRKVLTFENSLLKFPF